MSLKTFLERHTLIIYRDIFYLFSFQVTPSLVSFTSNPASAKASRIWSLVAQSLAAFALARRLRTMSTTLP